MKFSPTLNPRPWSNTFFLPGFNISNHATFYLVQLSYKHFNKKKTSSLASFQPTTRGTTIMLCQIFDRMRNSKKEKFPVCSRTCEHAVYVHTQIFILIHFGNVKATCVDTFAATVVSRGCLPQLVLLMDDKLVKGLNVPGHVFFPSQPWQSLRSVSRNPKGRYSKWQ